MKRSPLKPSTKPLRRRKPLSKVSAKRKREGKTYAELRKKFLEDHPFCEVCKIRTAVERIDVKPSTDVHHKGGRGRLMLRVDTWMAVCRTHHEMIHENPAWAKSVGFILTPEQRRKIS